MMDSYMRGWKNSVKIGEHMSTLHPYGHGHGVGEDSVFGPLIFLTQILEVSLVMEIVREKSQQMVSRNYNFHAHISKVVSNMQ